MDDMVANEISKKLNVLISLSLRHLAGERDFTTKAKGVGQQARYLSRMGLSSSDIANILGAPVSSVRTLLTPGRKK